MGSFKCTSTRCQTCQHVPLTKRFVSNYTRRSYIIKDTLDCKSHNIIYLINCKKCKKQYVGETGRQLSERLANHKSNIKLKRNTPVASHFNENGHTIQDLSITPIEQIKQPKNQTLRWQRELGWIEELMTYNPFGLNQQRREQSTSMEWWMNWRLCQHTLTGLPYLAPLSISPHYTLLLSLPTTLPLTLTFNPIPHSNPNSNPKPNSNPNSNPKP